MTSVDDLGRLREQLGELLGLLDDERSEPASLARALHSCHVVFETLRAGFPSLGELDAAEREHLAGALETTLRLNAVALGRASHADDSLTLGISRAKQAVRHARALAGEDASGVSYDLSA